MANNINALIQQFNARVQAAGMNQTLLDAHRAALNSERTALVLAIGATNQLNDAQKQALLGQLAAPSTFSPRSASAPDIGSWPLQSATPSAGMFGRYGRPLGRFGRLANEEPGDGTGEPPNFDEDED